MKKSIFCIFYFFLLVIPSYSQIVDTIAGGRLEEVEVSAQMKPSSTKSTSPLQVVSNADIDRIGIQSVSDAVRRFSGVSVKDYGGLGGMKTVSIRGMGAQHTAVSYDGVTFSNVQSGQTDIGRFSLDNVSMITLSIGQSDNIFQSARSYASAGILEIITGTPDFYGKKYRTNIQVKTGSFGLFNPVVYYAYKLNSKFSISANAGWERADGKYKYEIENINTTEEHKRKNSDVNIWRTEVNLYGDMGRGGLLKFKVNYFDSDRGIPGSYVLYTDNSEQRMLNKDVFAQAYYKNKLNEKFSLQSQAKFTRTFYKYTDRNINYPSGLKIDRVTQFEYYLSAGVLYKPFDELSISLVEDITRNSLKNNVSEVREPHRFSSLSALAAQFDNKYITVTGSLLATYVNESAKEGKAPDDKKKITPAVSFSLLPFQNTNLRLRGSYKKIFRIPTFDDLFYVRMGNINLKPEYATQYNIGITYSLSFPKIIDFASLSVDAYRNNVTDKIIAFPVSASIFKMRNFGKARMKGIDTNLNIHFLLASDYAINLSGNYSYQEVLDVTTPSDPKTYKNQLPYTPKNSGSGAVSFENPFVNITYNFVASGKRYQLDENIPDNELDSYTDHSISLNRTFDIKKSKLRLQANFLNLGNKNYQIVAYYPMPGRSFTVSANYSF